jgi:hypothetical protein
VIGGIIIKIATWNFHYILEKKLIEKEKLGRPYITINK